MSENEELSALLNGLSNVDSPGKSLSLFFVIDATKSMRSLPGSPYSPIDMVNVALRELINQLKVFERSNSVKINLTILTFSNSVMTVTDRMNIQDCIDIPYIDVRPGLTRYGVVFGELNKLLVEDRIIGVLPKTAPPVIIFMTDGKPDGDYTYQLDRLLGNEYFKLSQRSVILMGDAEGSHEAKKALIRFADKEERLLNSSNYMSLSDAIIQETILALRNDFVSPLIPVDPDFEPAAEASPGIPFVVDDYVPAPTF